MADNDPVNDLTARRMVPGDLMVKDNHVAIVNYITGDRGENDIGSGDYREASDIKLIHAVSSPQYVIFGADDPDTWTHFQGVENGLVTDTWDWDDFNNTKDDYTVRRLLP
ncbi:MAG: hypothetical protein GF344_06195 [Chitinivibrionales bacterium]|nr:hypothetical protein [Chitinivibrionales bacterium]